MNSRKEVQVIPYTGTGDPNVKWNTTDTLKLGVLALFFSPLFDWLDHSCSFKNTTSFFSESSCYNFLIVVRLSGPCSQIRIKSFFFSFFSKSLLNQK